MKHGSLFSGIGGFDLAAEWMGWDNVFHCEWNEFGKKVLNYYWPNAISYHDITKTDFTIHRGEIDILTGGFPCQPYSAAGKRLGKEDDRHLWPEMLRAIREIQPAWVVGENVRGLTNWNGGMVFDEVQADLEAEGYEVTPFLLPACAVNAPHIRQRIWIIAYSSNAMAESLRSGRENSIHEFGTTTDTISSGYNGESEKTGSDNTFLNGWMEPKIGQHRNEIWSKAERCGPNISRGNIQAWESFTTQSPICSGDDGIPRELDGITFPKWRNESIKAYGNAIVPQVALQIFKSIQQNETSIRQPGR